MLLHASAPALVLPEIFEADLVGVAGDGPRVELGSIRIHSGRPPVPARFEIAFLCDRSVPGCRSAPWLPPPVSSSIPLPLLYCADLVAGDRPGGDHAQAGIRRAPEPPPRAGVWYRRDADRVPCEATRRTMPLPSTVDEENRMAVGVPEGVVRNVEGAGTGSFASSRSCPPLPRWSHRSSTAVLPEIAGMIVRPQRVAGALNTRSEVLVPSRLSWKRSPRAEVKVLPWTVTFSVAAVPWRRSGSSRSRCWPSLPFAVLFAPTVTLEKVTRFRVPAVLTTRMLSEMPPLTLSFENDADPVRFVNETLPSLNGPAALLPLIVPLIVVLFRMNPLTLVPPRMAKFWRSRRLVRAATVVSSETLLAAVQVDRSLLGDGCRRCS